MDSQQINWKIFENNTGRIPDAFWKVEKIKVRSHGLAIILFFFFMSIGSFFEKTEEKYLVHISLIFVALSILYGVFWRKIHTKKIAKIWDDYKTKREEMRRKYANSKKQEIQKEEAECLRILDKLKKSEPLTQVEKIYGEELYGAQKLKLIKEIEEKYFSE